MYTEHIPRANISAAHTSSATNILKEESKKPVLRCDPERGACLLLPMEVTSIIFEKLPSASLLQLRLVSKEFLRIVDAAPSQGEKFFEYAEIARNKYKSGEVILDLEMIDSLIAGARQMLPKDRVAGLHILAETLEHALKNVMFNYYEGGDETGQALFTGASINQIISIHGLSDSDKVKLICARTRLPEPGPSQDNKAVELLVNNRQTEVLVEYMDAVLGSNLTEENKREILSLHKGIGRPEDACKAYGEVVMNSKLSEGVKQSLLQNVTSVDDSAGAVM